MRARFGSSRINVMHVKPGPTQSGCMIPVGGVVLPTVNYFILAMLALFVLWLAFLMYRKRNTVIRFFAPMLLRLNRI